MGKSAGVKAVVVFLRIVQAVLVFTALVIVAGALSVNILKGIALFVFALVLLAFAGVAEAVVRLVRGQWG